MSVAAKPPVRKYVPAKIDVSNWDAVEPLFTQLINRNIDTADALKSWLDDFSELSAVLDEYGSRLYVKKSCDTENAEIKKAFLHFVENIDPHIKPLYFKMQQKFAASPARGSLKFPGAAILEKHWHADVKLFRDENIPLQTDETKLVMKYDELAGAQMVTYRGKELTLQQAARFLEEPDRAVREETWKLTAYRRMADAKDVEAIFDDLLKIRQRIALNAGLADYREYAWLGKKRFDYTPADCLKFADAIEKCVMPIVRKLDDDRKAALKVDALRPWDMAVDPKNRQPLRPFKETEIDAFVDKARTIFSRLSPDLAAQFETLRTNGNLDLASRKGKQPGGYQACFEEVRQPFIFMNAAGVQRDVETLLHEGGHAFHTLAALDIPLLFLRSAPMEFCEVASMSMEAMSADFLDVYYENPADAARAKRNYFEGVIRFFPWMATIDTFQHWLYTHDRHTRAERADAWDATLNRFASKLDWTGHEAVRGSMWQRQLHLFHSPFYYVEYGIAQIGALQLWMKSKQDMNKAVANYRNGLKHGGTRSLPDLFAASGIAFDFTEKTLRPLMEAIAEELAHTPA